MVVNRHRNSLLCILLPYHILVKLTLNLMGRRNILNVNQGLFLLPLLLLLNLLLLGDMLLHVSHIENLHPRNVHIHQLAVINLTVHHCVKAFLHTVTAD